MRNLVQRFLTRNRESTASRVSRDLLGKGISPDEINADHIAHVYRSLKRISTSPDFTSLQEILPVKGKQEITTSDPIWGVIVETRKHPALERVIGNMMDTAQIPVQLFHGTRNLNFIMSTGIAPRVREGKVRLTPLSIDDLTPNIYNALFLSQRFWEHVHGRGKILVFQTDTICCRQSDYTLNDFIKYDYIGSKWSLRRPVGLDIEGGNGGLSLRDWRKSCDCLHRFPPKHWGAGEDGYFAFHLELIGGQVGKGMECARFSTQKEFLCRSWGAHKISYLSKRNRKAFLQYCPEAGFMLGDI